MQDEKDKALRRLWILDLDGTLIDDATGKPFNHIEALLGRAHKQGITLALSTFHPDAEARIMQLGWKPWFEDRIDCRTTGLDKSLHVTTFLQQTSILAANTLFADNQPENIEDVKAVHPTIQLVRVGPTGFQDPLPAEEEVTSINPLVRVDGVSGQRRLVATRTIRPGELMLHEAPLVSVLYESATEGPEILINRFIFALVLYARQHGAASPKAKGPAGAKAGDQEVIRFAVTKDVLPWMTRRGFVLEDPRPLSKEFMSNLPGLLKTLNMGVDAKVRTCPFRLVNRFAVCFAHKDQISSSTALKLGLRVMAYVTHVVPLLELGAYGLALYDISSFANHSCRPNASHVFRASDQSVYLVANCEIAEGDEVTLSYILDSEQVGTAIPLAECVRDRGLLPFKKCLCSFCGAYTRGEVKQPTGAWPSKYPMDTFLRTMATLQTPLAKLQLNEAAPGLLQLVVEIHRCIKTEQKSVTEAMTRFGKLAVETSLRMPIINLARAICVYDGLDSLDMKESWALSIIVELLEVWLCVATALHEEEPRRSWRYNLVIQCMGIILASHLGPWMEAAQPDNKKQVQDEPILEMLTVMHKRVVSMATPAVMQAMQLGILTMDMQQHPAFGMKIVDVVIRTVIPSQEEAQKRLPGALERVKRALRD